MDVEYITVSDDDEVEFLEQIYNLEPEYKPAFVDLTDEVNPPRTSPPPNQPAEPPPPEYQEPVEPNPTHQFKQTYPQPRHYKPSQPPHNYQFAQHPRPHDYQPFAKQTHEQEQTDEQPPNHEPFNSQSPHEQQTNHQSSQDQHTNHKSSQEQHNNNQSLVNQPPKHQSPDEQQSNHKPPHLEPPNHINLNHKTPIHQPPVDEREFLQTQKALGDEKYRKKNFDEAVRTYRRCIEVAKKLGDNKMSAILHFNLAMSYFNLRSYDQAAGECSNAVKLDDNYMKAHLKRAEIYQRQFKFEEAVICYEHICSLDKDNSDYKILLNRAREAAKLIQKKDHYVTLGLRPNCTMEDLKKAYRQCALKHHPDRHSNADPVTRRIEEKRFKDASEAHLTIQKRFQHY